jgi:hypothetical protein
MLLYWYFLYYGLKEIEELEEWCQTQKKIKNQLIYQKIQ